MVCLVFLSRQLLDQVLRVRYEFVEVLHLHEYLVRSLVWPVSVPTCVDLVHKVLNMLHKVLVALHDLVVYVLRSVADTRVQHVWRNGLDVKRRHEDGKPATYLPCLIDA